MRRIAVFLLAVGGLLAAVPAAAQTGLTAGQTVGVGNLGQTTYFGRASVGRNASSGRYFIGAQPFITGGGSGNRFALTDVTVSISDVVGTPGDFTVTIHAPDSAAPANPATAALARLTGPARPSGGNITYAAAGTVTLTGASTYFVLFTTPNLQADDRYRLALTQSNAEDAGAASGWSIADSRRFSRNGEPWQTHATKFKIRVRATVAAAANTAPVASGSLPAQTLTAGLTPADSVTVDVSAAFTDADGDALTYAVAGSAPGVAGVAIAGDTLTITALAAGNAQITVTPNDGTADGATQQFAVTVLNPPPDFAAAGVANQLYAQNTAILPLTLPAVTAGTGVAPVAYSLAPPLPAGLLFNANARVISGTPTATLASTEFTLTAADANPRTPGSDTLTFRLQVNPALTFGSASVGNQLHAQNTAITALQLPAVTANTGVGNVRYAVSPTLPAGLAFDAGARVISGTPTATLTDTEFTLTATDGNTPTPGTATLQFRLRVNPPLGFAGAAVANQIYARGSAIVPLTLPGAVMDSGVGAISYSLSPPLPAGLAFDAGARVISGTPTATLTDTEFTLTATDGNTPTPGTATLQFRLRVNPPLGFAGAAVANQIYARDSAIVPLTLPGAVMDSGVGAVAYSLSPPLPAGLAFDAGARVISGTPTATLADTEFTLTAGDANPAGAARVQLRFRLRVNAALAFAGPAVAEQLYVVGAAALSLTLPAATLDSGVGAVEYSLAPPLPAGLTLDADARVISGVPTAMFANTEFTLTVTDNNRPTPGRATLTFRLRVNPPLAFAAGVADLIYTRGMPIAAVTLPARTAGSGRGEVRYALAPALPAGLTFDAATRVLSGVPTAAAATATFAYSAMDGGRPVPAVATEYFAITVVADTARYAEANAVVLPALGRAMMASSAAAIARRLESARSPGLSGGRTVSLAGLQLSGGGDWSAMQEKARRFGEILNGEGDARRLLEGSGFVVPVQIGAGNTAAINNNAPSFSSVRKSNRAQFEARGYDFLTPRESRLATAHYDEGASADRKQAKGPFVEDHGIDHKIPESARNIRREKAPAVISLPFENDGGSVYRGRKSIAFWGAGDYRDLSGEGDGIQYDGRISGVHLGIDGRSKENLLLGVAASALAGDAEFSDAQGKGEYELEVQSLHPYLGWRRGPLDGWASVGVGGGELAITPADGVSRMRRESDLTLRQAGVGGGGRLWADANGDGRLKAEVLASEMDVAGKADVLAAQAVRATRARVLMQAGFVRPTASGAVRSALEFGVRADGGDGGAGTGVELGGGVGFAGARVALDLRARGLLRHSDDAREWGVSGGVRVSAGADGQGLALRVSPGYGLATASGVGRLWAGGLRGLARDASSRDYALRVDARAGYGLRGRDGLLTPFAAAVHGGHRLGVRWEAALVELELAGERGDDGGAVVLRGRVKLQ